MVAVPSESSDSSVPNDISPSKSPTDGSVVSNSSKNQLTLGHYISSIEQEQSEHTGRSLTNLILGASDYNPVKARATKNEWEALEMAAAAGRGGSLHENFRSSVLMMDNTTDNSTIPFCVVHGECTVV